MAVYCSKCGAQMNEKDEFCGKCGAPAAKIGRPETGGGADAQKHKIIGIAVIAVLVLVAGSFLMKGFGGKQEASGAIPPSAGEPAVDDTVAHLTPWMGDWVKNFVAHPDQGSGLLHTSNEGLYNGYILSWSNGTAKGMVHIDEQYIDLSDVTKDQKDRFPVSSLVYSETSFGADAFEDPDRGIRFIFYEHFKTYEGSQDYGKVMNIQAYVGMEEPEINYFEGLDGQKYPIGFTGHKPGPDGWAVDIAASFVPVDG